MPDTDLESEYLAALAALERGDAEQARRRLERFVLEVPAFAPAWDGLGRCFDELGDLERASDCFRKAIRLDPGSWRSRYDLGVALHRGGQLPHALRRLREAAQRGPDQRLVHQRLGRVLFDLGRYDAAVTAYRKALEQPEREVRDAELLADIGQAETQRGEYEAAEDAFERACLLVPDDPRVLWLWGVLSLRRGDVADAERQARRAQSLAPRSLDIARFRVCLAIERKDWDVVSARIAELDAVPGAACTAGALRAEAEWRRGDRERARSLALEALRDARSGHDPGVELILTLLRKIRSRPAACRSYRVLLEVLCGDESYFRPFYVQAEDSGEAERLAGELQWALEPNPWQVEEIDEYPGTEESLVGVYQLQLTRVLFPRETDPSPIVQP